MGQIGARREMRTEDSSGVMEAEWRPWGEERGRKGQRVVTKGGRAHGVRGWYKQTLNLDIGCGSFLLGPETLMRTK